eukprot:g9990.t1
MYRSEAAADHASWRSGDESMGLVEIIDTLCAGATARVSASSHHPTPERTTPTGSFITTAGGSLQEDTLRAWVNRERRGVRLNSSEAENGLCRRGWGVCGIENAEGDT